MSEERLDRLEARLATLEKLVRELAAQSSAFRVPRSELPPAPEEAVEEIRTRTAPPVPSISAAHPTSQPNQRGTRNAERPAPRLSRGGTFINEEWLGTRGLLAVGVIFLVLAAGYLLKLSFDRGWISPAVRCVSGTFVGIGIAAFGWRLHRKGLRSYGASLIGAGFAIMYLAAWAAGRLSPSRYATTGSTSSARASRCPGAGCRALPRACLF